MSPLDLESRLRSYAKTYEEDAQPPAGFHQQILSRTTEPTRRRPNLVRELAFAAAFLLFIGLLAVGAAQLKNLTTSGAGKHRTKPTPTVQSRVVPWIAASPTPMPPSLLEPQSLSLDQASATIWSTVTKVRPLLLPTALPIGAQEHVSAQSDSFTVEYRTNQADIALMIAKPDLGIPPANITQRTFRGVPALYEVSLPDQPSAGQFLIWTEPGSSPLDPNGVPYFLKVGGLTQSEFWQVANSFHPIAAPAAPPCKASDLTVVYAGGQGATGHWINGISMANHAANACMLQGYPQLQLIVANGSALPVAQTDGNGWVGGAQGPVILTPNQPRSEVANPLPGQAYVNFEWIFCPEPQPVIASIRLSLGAGRGTVTMPASAAGQRVAPSYCNDSSQGRHLWVGPYQLVPNTAADQDAPTLAAKISIPATARTGKRLAYTLTLTNVSKGPVVFSLCPSYVEILGRKLAMGSYQLNCKAALPIPVGGSETFAMVLDLPANLSPGRQTLSWYLDSPFLVEARATVDITNR
jgi:hypothetical protein